MSKIYTSNAYILLPKIHMKMFGLSYLLDLQKPAIHLANLTDFYIWIVFCHKYCNKGSHYLYLTSNCKRLFSFLVEIPMCLYGWTAFKERLNIERWKLETLMQYTDWNMMILKLFNQILLLMIHLACTVLQCMESRIVPQIKL